MSTLPDPAWPVVVLALIQVVDGVLCVKPARFVAECLEAVRWPRRLWRLLPPLKFGAAAGLVAGVWVPLLGALTCAALIAYFIVAIAMHVAARDFGRNLFVNAAGMLAISVATVSYSFLA
ncbi:DoxX family protein [Catellatospora sichuanensis]|uniref:DoxX family protein n=1 Tax=Catellatospora sichuanensis TaxID=1969805 RepID=UPI001C91240A|nr:DoxX family protein [Catellatospora sichuanensis]